VVLVSEFIENGSLADLLFKSSKPLSMNQKLEIAIEIAEGMAWLSGGQTTIIHKDLKPHNILLTKECHCKIADFGLSCLQEKRSQQQVGSTSGGGTLAYMAPEVLTYYENSGNNIVTVKSDVYSFGVMLYEILCQKKFTQIEDWEELEKYILAGNRPRITCHLSQRLHDLVVSCWSLDPNDRPTFCQIDDILKAELKARENQFLSEILSNQEDAIQFWSKHTNDKKTIKLSEFVRFLLQNLPNPNEISPNQLQDQLASLLFPSTTKRNLPNELVTLTQFGNLIYWFGDFKNLLPNLFFLMAQEWFHGAITRPTADLLLQGRNSGTFLVRVNTGTNPDSPVSQYPHTISFVNAKKTLHVRLTSGIEHFNLRLPIGDQRPPIVIQNSPICLIIEELKKQGVCLFPQKKDRQKSPYID